MQCRIRIFWSIECRKENSDDLLSDRLKNLSEERNRLNRDCPQVPKWAYLKAKKGIEEGESIFEVDVNPEIKVSIKLIWKKTNDNIVKYLKNFQDI